MKCAWCGRHEDPTDPQGFHYLDLEKFMVCGILHPIQVRERMKKLSIMIHGF